MGEPWGEGRDGYNGFISSFKKAKAKAGIEGVNFSDLRGPISIWRDGRHPTRVGGLHDPGNLRHNRSQPRGSKPDLGRALLASRPGDCMERDPQA
jgi:hypothetical protein